MPQLARPTRSSIGATVALICGLGGCGSTAAPEGSAASGAGRAADGVAGGSAFGGAPATAGSGGLSGAGGTSGGSSASAGMPSGGAGASDAAGRAGGGAAGSGGDGAAGGGSGTAGGPDMGSATFEIAVELASDVLPTAPTTVGIVRWSVNVEDLVDASIEFGLDTSYGMTAPVDLAEPEHRTLLVGMKPEHTYHFRIVARDASKTVASADQTLTTGAAPTGVALGGFNVMSASEQQRGFILTSYRQGDNAAFIVDADGDIVWWYLDGPSDGIARARLSADGESLWLVSSGNTAAPLVRMSLDTLEVDRFATSGGTHDITPIGGSSMLYLDYSEDDCTSVFEIDPSGMPVEFFESDGVVESTGGMLGCHGNAVRYSEKEDVVTFSDLNQDILALDRSGTVLWRLSERVSGGNDTWGGLQHGHQLLDDGILIFANQGDGGMASAAIEYDLEGVERRRFPSHGYSANLGDVQRLPADHTLVTYSNEGVIQEVDADGSVVLELSSDGAGFGYALWLEDLYDPAFDTR
jgi:hypothetical protein